jgi:uncharacterized protein (TIGR00255 family)
MTGFGRAASRKKKGGWAVEIRSLNHRYFELSLKSPPALYGIEDRIRELCQSRIKRGKVMVNVNETDGIELEGLELDEEVLQFYLQAIRRIQRRFRLSGDLSVSDLLALPRIFSLEKKAVAPEKLWKALREPLEEALRKLVGSRVREGKALSKDLLGRIGKIERTLHRIEARTKRSPAECYEKLRGRIEELFREKPKNEERLWQEAAILAEKADVTEEVVRLKSHLQLFRSKVAKQEEVGKELDFLLQEMNREANTLSVKAQDFEISKEVVGIKAELEKIREQIQNIE